MKRFAVIFIFAFSLSVTGQEQKCYYSNPLKIPLILSGSFAELRSNHFHSGIDIKTRGVTGLPVYSVAEGNISRIVVSSSGFGKALYIDHPNGTTSVYGHLKTFREDIERYVKNIQYEQKSFEVDLQPSPRLFVINQNDFIAFSGNTGSSAGPHLHFEIRDTSSEEPLNPLKYNFTVNDQTAPKIFSLMVVPLNENSHVNYRPQKETFPVVYLEKNYHLHNNPIIPVYGNIGFAIQTNDFFDESNNKCGVYSIQLKFDGELYYSFKMDRFSFSETRYINSHIDYEEYTRSGRRFHKTWIDPGNQLSIYDYIRKNGTLVVNDGNIHHVRFEMTDTHGNKSVLDFNIESKSHTLPSPKKNYIRIMHHDRENHFRSGGLKVDFPENAFYTDIPFTYEKKLRPIDEFLSDIHVIHKESVPIHTRAQISIEVDHLKNDMQSKALLVKVDTLSGRYTSAGGKYKNGWVTGNIRSFGSYAVALDTLPPRVIPLSINNNSTLTESSRIRFRISDELSGIKFITGKLNGKWALFEYDKKNNLITHYFDAERFEQGKRHLLELVITDNSGNETNYEASFWK